MQFTAPHPHFTGVRQMELLDTTSATALSAEIQVMSVKHLVSIIPPQDVMNGIHSRYFLVPQKMWAYPGFLITNQLIAVKTFRMLRVDIARV